MMRKLDEQHCYTGSLTEETEILEKVLHKTNQQRHIQPTLILGEISDIDNENQLWVKHIHIAEPVKSLSNVPLSNVDIGRICTLAFLQGNLGQPVVTGLIHTPNASPDTIALQANDSVQLKCGNSRIQLDNRGHINIQGLSINNQACGPNRIKGGSVKFN